MLFPGDPCPPRPTGPLEPSLRPHIQGVWVLPPGAWHQAHTPQRGNPDPSASSGPAHETPASTPTSLSAQAAFLHPSQVGMWARVDPSAPPPIPMITRAPGPPPGHISGGEGSWLPAACCPAWRIVGHTGSIPALPSHHGLGGGGRMRRGVGGAGRLRAEMEVPPTSDPSPSPDSPRPWGGIFVQGSQL